MLSVRLPDLFASRLSGGETLAGATNENKKEFPDKTHPAEFERLARPYMTCLAYTDPFVKRKKSRNKKPRPPVRIPTKTARAYTPPARIAAPTLPLPPFFSPPLFPRERQLRHLM